MAEIRVWPPASTLAEERTMTPVMGRAQSRPQIALPTPCDQSSRSKSVRGPSWILSTADAQSSVAALATKARVAMKYQAEPVESSVIAAPGSVMSSGAETAVDRVSGTVT